MTLKRLNAVLLALGLFCLAWMIRAFGVDQVWRSLSALGWGLVPLAMIEGIGDGFHTAAWRCCLTGPARSQSFAQLFWKRLAGYAINYFTPTAALGGEITRASLIAVPGRAAEAASSVLIDKACMALAHLVLVVAGAVFLVWRAALPAALQIAMVITSGALGAGIIAFFWIQKHGRLGALARWLRAHRVGGAPMQKFAASLSAVDDAFRIFHRDRKKDLLRALTWHVIGFATGFLQAYGFFALIGQHPSVSVVATIWMVGLWFDLLVFVVPMSLGTLEGSRMVAFAAVGFQAVEGLTYGMVQRLGQWSWAVLGLAGYTLLTAKLPSAQKVTGERSVVLK